MRLSFVHLVVAATLVTACSDATRVPVAGPSFARPGAGDPRAVFEYPTDDGALKIRSDHRALSLDGTVSIYDDGACGVDAKIFAGGSGDAVMDPDANYVAGRDQGRCGPGRSITVIFDQPADGNPPPGNAIVTGGYFHNINELWQMPIGVEIEGQGGLNISRCNVLRFKPDPGHNGIAYPGSDKLLVLRQDASTWRVRTKPYPDNKAWCDTDGRLYHLPLQLTVRVKE